MADTEKALPTDPPAPKPDMMDSIKKLSDLGFKLFATEGTHHALKKHGIKSKLLHKIQSKQ